MKPVRLPSMASLGLACLALTACAVGPDYVAPTPLAPARLTAEPLPEATAGLPQPAARAQYFVDVRAMPQAWWTAFGNPALDRLVDQALANSPTVAAAEAALRVAQEQAAAQRGAWLPSVDASYTPQRARSPEVLSPPLNSGASIYTLHTASLNVSYVVDAFGGTRRAIESQDALAESQAWQLRAARLALAGNVVSAALQEAALREQLAALQRLADIAQQQWQLMQTQQRLGEAAGAAVLAQEVVFRQSQTAAAALRKQLAQQRDLLAALVGVTPSAFAAPGFGLAELALPDVPVLLNASAVAQRPDVRAAEAQLHSANAQVGVAVANMLPQITLGADYGASAESFGQLLRSSNVLWSLGAGITQPVFQGGSLLHRKRAAQAQLDQALATYQATVLAGFQNVADALEAVRHDADQHVASVLQLRAAEASLRVAKRQLAVGDISGLALLNAETALQQSALAQIQIQAERLSDVVAVYVALGGGWGDPAAPAPVTGN
jgi:NodT family efflux transporter outer membrane factor (OMF) lipoprotein